jgi:hypothetical protein
MGVIAFTTSKTAPRRRTQRVAVQPLSNTAGVSLGLGLNARQSAVDLGVAGSLVEIGLPVLG